MPESQTYAFKVSSRMPILLGDELIPNASYALFELVKNAHDADATTVLVDLIDANDEENGKIIIEDDGCGMDEDVISGSWLVMGTPFRRNQVKEGKITPKYNRQVLGEKGIGRFAAHKLGSKINVITRMLGKPEFEIIIDWTKFDPDEPQMIDQIPICVLSRVPVIFTGNQSGTRITITNLREPWTRGMARSLHRDITSISSPFDAPGEFQAILTVKPQKEWLDKLFSYEEAQKEAPFIATCLIEGDTLTYDYELNVPQALEGRIEKRTSSNVMKLNILEKKDLTGKNPTWLYPEEFNEFKKCGSIELRMLMYDLDNYFIKAVVKDPSGLKKFLSSNGGIRVYRGGIRVFGLGGEGEDWLNLGGRRVQLPASRLSNNVILGSVLLKPEPSCNLKEQTNRRGFIENTAFYGFKKALLQIISQLEAERFKDKDRIKAVVTGKKVKIPVLDELLQLQNS